MNAKIVEKYEDLIESPRFDLFTDWEKQFLESLEDYDELSIKQTEKLFQINEKYFG